MNNERNNLGVNNDLPPMGTMVDNNSETRLDLPPISNFTNFDDNNISNTTAVDNSNVSVFDLMDQFEQVNTMNNSINENNTQSISDVASQKNFMSINDSSKSSMEQQTPMFNASTGVGQPANNIPVQPNSESQVPMFNVDTGVGQSANNIPVQPNPESQVPMFNASTGVGQSANNIPVQANAESQAPMFNMDTGVGQSANNIPAQANAESQAPMFNMDTGVGQSANNIPVQANTESQAPMFNMNTGADQSVNNIQSESGIAGQPTNLNINNQEMQFMGNVQNIATEPMNTDDSNLVSSAPMINNQPQEELISKFSMDEPNSNENNSSNDDNAINLNNDTIFNTLEKNTNKVEEKIDNNKKSKKKKSKRKKLLFIILLIVTIILVGIVMVICYFKFWKSDKLVCSLQDYSNEQFLIEESMVMEFKGSNLVNTNFKRNLIFAESYIDTKSTYLEELRNQFEGLGFDVSYSENDTGFEINMNFTKAELENWYGTELKNSSKDNMIKEMKDVGYTCK